MHLMWISNKIIMLHMLQAIPASAANNVIRRHTRTHCKGISEHSDSATVPHVVSGRKCWTGSMGSSSKQVEWHQAWHTACGKVRANVCYFLTFVISQHWELAYCKFQFYYGYASRNACCDFSRQCNVDDGHYNVSILH
jgi:hypothetical protein